MRNDLIHQLNDFQLTTAEILYRFPDHPDLLQTYLWQDMDNPPAFPVLGKFLNFWDKNLDGKLHSVVVASQGLIKPSEFQIVDGIIEF